MKISSNSSYLFLNCNKLIRFCRKLDMSRNSRFCLFFFPFKSTKAITIFNLLLKTTLKIEDQSIFRTLYSDRDMTRSQTTLT